MAQQGQDPDPEAVPAERMGGQSGQPPAVDPVCGMTVALDAGKPTHVHRDATYHFCSQRCHDRFAADPYFFLSGNHRESHRRTKSRSPVSPEW